MIHRDYILRMVEEFMRVLAAIVFMKKARRWQELEGTLDDQFQRLVGVGAAAALGLSETELSAKLTRGEGTQLVQHKIRFLIRLFQEAGDAAMAQERRSQGVAFYLKGLDLLLQNVDVDATFNEPDYVPRMEAFRQALADEPLPARTAALLMQHYERNGLFGRAEDTLFAMLEDLGDSPEALDFGIAFYERLRGQSDAALQAGDLPRPEVKAGLAEIQARKAALPRS